MKREKILLILAVVTVLLSVVFIAGCTTPATPPATTLTATAAPTTPAQQQDLLIATTTSLYDTGLLDYLAGIFGPEYNANLRITAKGTGQALELGQNGDVDTVMVHDRVREDAFLANGYGIDRRVFAYNYFVIVGPPSDPAGIKNMTPVQAFDTIYKEAQTNPEVVFVSRGDESGTHAREQLLWKKAGYNYSDVRTSGSWYVESGTGMGATLQIADEKDAYTLSDIGTFLAYESNLTLVPLVTQGNDLINIYSAMIVNPAKFPDTNVQLSKEWINWLISPEGQDLIANYGVDKYGQPLFYPAHGNWQLLNVSQAETQDPIP
jgi:tungstate transport system substrate-binding protein